MDFATQSPASAMHGEMQFRSIGSVLLERFISGSSVSERAMNLELRSSMVSRYFPEGGIDELDDAKKAGFSIFFAFGRPNSK
jgi:hypothetical protein